MYEDLRREAAGRVAASGADGVAVGGSLGQEKAQMREVVGWSLEGAPDDKPRHLLGIGVRTFERHGSAQHAPARRRRSCRGGPVKRWLAAIRAVVTSNPE